MLAPMRLPIMPPIAAPAIPAAMCSPVPPPNCDPISPPASAPIRVPVFSFAPCPVSGVAAQAATETATITAMPRLAICMTTPHPDHVDPAGTPRPAIWPTSSCLYRLDWGKTLFSLSQMRGKSPNPAVPVLPAPAVGPDDHDPAASTTILPSLTSCLASSSASASLSTLTAACGWRAFTARMAAALSAMATSAHSCVGDAPPGLGMTVTIFHPFAMPQYDMNRCFGEPPRDDYFTPSPRLRYRGFGRKTGPLLSRKCSEPLDPFRDRRMRGKQFPDPRIRQRIYDEERRQRGLIVGRDAGHAPRRSVELAEGSDEIVSTAAQASAFPVG